MSNEQWFLRDLRNELGLSQEAVANDIMSSQIRISLLERGEETPTQEERQALVDAMIRRTAVKGLEILLLNRK